VPRKKPVPAKPAAKPTAKTAKAASAKKAKSAPAAKAKAPAPKPAAKAKPAAAKAKPPVKARSAAKAAVSEAPPKRAPVAAPAVPAAVSANAPIPEKEAPRAAAVSTAKKMLAAVLDAEEHVEFDEVDEALTDAGDADIVTAVAAVKTVAPPVAPLPPPHPGTPGKHLQKIVELLGRRYEAEGKRAELNELGDPFQLGAWFILGQRAKRNGQARAYDALRRAKGLTPGQLLDIAPEKLAGICQIAGPYEDARAKDLYAYADEIEEKCGQDFSKIFKSQADARKFLETELRRGSDFVEFLLLYGGKFPLFPLDAAVIRVAVRLGFVKAADGKNIDDKTKKELQRALESEGPKDISWIKRAHGLLHRHGMDLCTATAPHCEQCPAAKECPYLKAHPLPPKDPAAYRRPWETNG
jgi:endonuclease III